MPSGILRRAYYVNKFSGHTTSSMNGDIQSDLPEGWEWCLLPDVAQIVMGQSPPSATYNNCGDGLPFFQGKAEFGDLYPTLRMYCSRPKKIAKQGATLLSVRAPVGPTNLAPHDCCIGRGLAALHPYDRIEPKFLLYLLRNIEPVLSSKGTGSTFKAITKEFVENLEFHLPPLPEQRRIVAKIEELFSELDKGVESLKKAREQLKVYRQAVLKHAFEGKLTTQWREENKDKLESAEQLLTRIKQEREARYEQQLEEWNAAVKTWEASGQPSRKPTRPRLPEPRSPVSRKEFSEHDSLPSGWRRCFLTDFAGIVMGQSPSSSTYNREGDGLPFFQGKAEFGELHPAVRIYCSQPKKIAKPGATLLSVRAPVGPTNLTQQECCIGRGLVALHARGGMDPKFLLYLFRNIEPNISKKGTGSTFTAVTKEFVESLQFDLPPLAEQRLMVARMQKSLTSINKTVEAIDTQLVRAQTLRHSVLKTAFSGHLVPQDPNEESAFKLLERIKAQKANGKSPQRDRRGRILA